MSKLFAVTRSFQGGATFETFDVGKFRKGVVDPLKKLFATAPPEFNGIAVVTCAELGSKYAEEVRDYVTGTNVSHDEHDWENPTTHHLREAFPDEISSGRLVPVMCKDWGLNVGSATALNKGIEIAGERGATEVLCWSPEIALTGDMINSMLTHMERHGLPLVGHLRNNWPKSRQWMFAQNTIAIWKLDVLESVGGFNFACNGDGVSVVETSQYGKVLLAGMEDYYAWLCASLKAGHFLPWGMVGVANPAYWDQALKKPGTPEYLANLQKIARQRAVMDAYANRIFPELSAIEVFDAMMEVSKFEFA